MTILEIQKQGSAVYDRADGQLYVKKERENGHYWICIPKGKFRLSSHTAYIKEKWEYVEDELKLIYEPVYERYEEGEVLLDPNGVPIQGNGTGRPFLKNGKPRM